MDFRKLPGSGGGGTYDEKNYKLIYRDRTEKAYPVSSLPANTWTIVAILDSLSFVAGSPFLYWSGGSVAASVKTSNTALGCGIAVALSDAALNIGDDLYSAAIDFLNISYSNLAYTNARSYNAALVSESVAAGTTYHLSAIVYAAVGVTPPAGEETLTVKDVTGYMEMW